MANNIMQITRSALTAIPTGLANGQLAYTSNGDILYIQSPAAANPIIAIGGRMYPGILTANLALVANATLGLNNIILANASILSYLSANGSQGTSGYVLTSGGTTANASWQPAVSGVAGLTTQVMFNLGGVLSGNAGFTYVPSTNTVTIANSISVGTFTANSTLANVNAINVITAVNTATLFISTTANVGANVQLTTTGAAVYSNVVVNTSVNTVTNSSLLATGLNISYFSGNTVSLSTGTINATSNSFLNSNNLIIGNSTVNSTVNSTTFFSGVSTINALGAFIGANASINTTALVLSANVIVSGTVNTTANIIANGNAINIYYWSGNSTVNTYSNTFANATTVIVGNSTVNTVINATSIVSGNATVFFTSNSSSEAMVGVGSNVVTTAISIFIGNSTVNSTVNSTLFTGTANNATNLGGVASGLYQLNSTLAANVATLAANNSLYLGGIAAANYVTNIGNFTLAGNNIFAGTNTVISSNLTVSSALITAATATLSVQNITVTGNLTVSGTVETINTSQLTVNSNFIELGSHNTTTDLVDTGWFSPAGNTTLTWYSLFGRVASKSTNNNPYFYLGASNTNPNTSLTFDIGAANAATGTLQSYLAPFGAGGGFVVNSTAVTVTANSTWAANFVANSLTLTTALLATYGGTGLSTHAAGDIQYAATLNPTALSKLSVPGAAANGQVLQITNNLPSYGSLDGGIF